MAGARLHKTFKTPCTCGIELTACFISIKMITKINISDKLLAYLQHRLSLADLVEWAEQSLMNGNYEDDNLHTIRNTLSHLGLADVKAFGLEWKDCETIMEQLGFRLEVKALAVA